MEDLFSRVSRTLDFAPGEWSARAIERGSVSAVECLALVLFAVRVTFNLADERRIVDAWAKELRKAAAGDEIRARDPVTLLQLSEAPQNWDWIVALDDADCFVTSRGMGFSCSERARHIDRQCNTSWAAETSAAAAPAAAPAVMKREALHKTAILQHLHKVKHEPKALPPYKNGLADPVKQHAKKCLVPSTMTESAFEKAWLALLSAKDIARAP